MVHLFEDCNLCAIHAKRVTISEWGCFAMMKWMIRAGGFSLGFKPNIFFGHSLAFYPASLQQQQRTGSRTACPQCRELQSMLASLHIILAILRLQKRVKNMY